MLGHRHYLYSNPRRLVLPCRRLRLILRPVVGWSMSSRIESEFVTQALLAAVWRRKHGEVNNMPPLAYEKLEKFKQKSV